jgi:hypothetical protein
MTLKDFIGIKILPHIPNFFNKALFLASTAKKMYSYMKSQDEE